MAFILRDALGSQSLCERFAPLAEPVRLLVFVPVGTQRYADHELRDRIATEQCAERLEHGLLSDIAVERADRQGERRAVRGTSDADPSLSGIDRDSAAA